MKISLKPGIGAVSSSFFAVICCISPLLMAAIGVGGAAVSITLMRYQWLFVSIGGLLVGVSFYAYLREKRRCDIKGCSMPLKGLNLFLLYLSSIIILILILGLIFPSITYQVLKFIGG